MDPYDYFAPSSGDILKIANSDCSFSDEYFNVNHDDNQDGVLFKQPIANLPIKQEIISPTSQVQISNLLPTSDVDVVVKKELKTPEKNDVPSRQHRRRSMSVHAVMESTGIKPLNGLTDAMKHYNISSQFKCKNDLSTKALSTASSQNNLHTSSKFISMAEAIYHLQRDTPKRFHSSSRKQEPRELDAAFNRKKVQQLKSTIPQSPALKSKTRTRPVHALSQKEIEDKEFEEMKKHKIKALPISSAVLNGICHLAPVQRKPVTHPEPFNLTQLKKKPVMMDEKKPTFTARPVPKYILEKPAEPAKKVLPCTIPVTPKFMSYRSRSLEEVLKPANKASTVVPKRTKCPIKEAEKACGAFVEQSTFHTGVPVGQKIAQHPCKPQPFSFERRDKERQMKRMEKIEKIYEEEKKLREFHANPMPSAILKTKPIASPKYLHKKKNHNKENVADDIATHNFKARPALVLFKEPFVPARKERALMEPCQIELTTEKRARERDEFNQKLKEKDEHLQKIKIQAEEERKLQEEREAATMRAQLVHKALPIRHYHPFVIHPSNIPLTQPESPHFALHKQAFNGGNLL